MWEFTVVQMCMYMVLQTTKILVELRNEAQVIAVNVLGLISQSVLRGVRSG